MNLSRFGTVSIFFFRKFTSMVVFFCFCLVFLLLSNTRRVLFFLFRRSRFLVSFGVVVFLFQVLFVFFCLLVCFVLCSLTLFLSFVLCIPLFRCDDDYDFICIFVRFKNHNKSMRLIRLIIIKKNRHSSSHDLHLEWRWNTAATASHMSEME